jgi:predicted enzyme related to lactoylglutathione lyase
MLNFNSILVFSADPGKLADFYQGVFATDPVIDSGGYKGFQVGSGFITIGPHDQVHGSNTNPERILLNLETSDVRGEFDRIKRLGAKVIAEPYQMNEADTGWIATLADPDGNYFQLMTPFDPSQMDLDSPR